MNIMTCEFCRKWTAQSRVVLEAQLAMLRYKPEGMPLCPRCKQRDWARSAESLVEEPESRGIDWIVVAVVLVLMTAIAALVLILLIRPASPTNQGEKSLQGFGLALMPESAIVPPQVVADSGSLRK